MYCSAANYYGSRVVAYAFRGRLRTLRKLKQTTRMKNSEVHFSCKKIDNYSVLVLTKRSAMRPVSFSALRAHRGESSVTREDSQITGTRLRVVSYLTLTTALSTLVESGSALTHPLTGFS